MNTSNNNDIMMTSDDDKAAKIYSTEGDLKFTIKVPEGHNVKEVAFHITVIAKGDAREVGHTISDPSQYLARLMCINLLAPP